VKRGIWPIDESIADTVISVRRWNFGNSAINRGCICISFNAHARNCLISGLKSDVIVVFLDPNFFLGVIREHLRQKLTYLCLHGFSGPFGPNSGFWGQNRERGDAMLTPNELVLTFWGFYLCATFGKNRSRNATVTVWTDRQTDTCTDRQTEFVICPMLCAIAVGQIKISRFTQRPAVLYIHIWQKTSVIGTLKHDLLRNY